MKQLAVLFFALALASAQADTNVFPVLTTANGISYTNARIDRTTPVEAIVWHNAGISRVALTNLPEPLRQKYPYDAGKAAEYLAAEKAKKQKQEAAELAQAVAEQKQAVTEQKRLETLAKSAGWISIVDLNEKGSSQYIAIIGGVWRPIYLNNPPKGLDAAVRQLSDKRRQFQSEYTSAVLEGDQAAQLLAVQNAKKLILRVRAFDTGKAYNGIPIWQFVAKND